VPPGRSNSCEDRSTMLPDSVKLTPGKRVLYLTKDPELIRQQLAGDLTLKMRDLEIEDLLDDINTDTMTPAWVCFWHRPEDIAREAYAGLLVDDERVAIRNALHDGNFEVIASGFRKGVGSSRETAVQAEKFSGIRIAIAGSFAPIHARNNINQGVLMADHDTLLRLEAGEAVPLAEFCRDLDAVSQLIVHHGGLFPFAKALRNSEVEIPTHGTTERPMTMGEKILARHLMGRREQEPGYVKPGDAVLVKVDGGYSHDFTSAQVHHFLQQEYGEDYEVRDAERFAAFEDHLVYAEDVKRLQPFLGNVQTMRDMQRQFQEHTGV
jgi:3-isopropylmalate/(R)-2-methylmalate dehydratase large subunit